MTIPVRLTQGAEGDLLGIYRRRLAQRGAGGKDGADALLDRLIEAIGALGQHPLRGPVPPELEALGQHPLRGPVPPELEALGILTYRQLSHPPYRVIYWPETDHADPTITVMLIADARRDFRVLLEERLLRGAQ